LRKISRNQSFGVFEFAYSKLAKEHQKDSINNNCCHCT
jgi:hypothetical protein